MKTKILFLLVFIGIGMSLQAANAKDVDTQLDQIMEEIDALKTELLIAKDEIAVFDLTTKNQIDKINTNAGPLYIQVRNISPSDEGYKVEIRIGNPLYASFRNVQLNVMWKSSNEWVEKSFDVNPKLTPSSWITTEVALTPVGSVEDLKAVLMNVDVGNLDLQNN